MSVYKTILLMGAAFSLSACASITSREEAGVEARSSLPETPEVWAAAQEKVGDVEVGWIASFNDPVLESWCAKHKRIIKIFKPLQRMWSGPPRWRGRLAPH